MSTNSSYLALLYLLIIVYMIPFGSIMQPSRKDRRVKELFHVYNVKKRKERIIYYQILLTHSTKLTARLFINKGEGYLYVENL